MRKLVLVVSLVLTIGSAGFGEGYFTESADGLEWAEYERLCWAEGSEPSWEKYLELIENGQCYGDSVEECSALFDSAD